MAKAPARKDLSADFPLRGFVTCGDCGEPYPAGWTKGRSAYYPYYLCDTRGCPSCRKVIRREHIEGDLEKLLEELRPSEGMFNMAFKMFRKAWDERAGKVRDHLAVVRRDVAEVVRRGSP